MNVVFAEVLEKLPKEGKMVEKDEGEAELLRLEFCGVQEVYVWKFEGALLKRTEHFALRQLLSYAR